MNLRPNEALLICRQPGGTLVEVVVLDMLVAEAKRVARDDCMPVIAVIRAKRLHRLSYPTWPRVHSELGKLQAGAPSPPDGKL